jgi:ABC-type glycerol-3-phosphate transport system substrate-binding protein
MDPYYYFADRLALAYAGTLEQIPIQTAWMAAEENEDAWTVMGFPGPAGETILVGGPGLSVTADTPERQMAAWLFARHLLDPEIQADLSRSGFSLPVRKSALLLLEDLMTSYPQWGLVAEKMEQADALPISESWGMAQWVLQDAVLRLLQVEADQLPGILEDLDATIIELEEMAP